MNKIKVTLNISEELNRFIEAEQEKNRGLEQKKPSKEDVLLGLCKIGYEKVQNQSNDAGENANLLNFEQNFTESEYKTESFAQRKADFTHQNNVIVQKIESLLKRIESFAQNFGEKVVKTTKNRFVFEEKDELEAMYEAILDRESILATKTTKMESDRDEFIQKQMDFMDVRDEFSGKMFEHQLLITQLKDRDDEIRQLKSNNNKFTEAIHENTRQLEKLTQELKYRPREKSDDGLFSKLLTLLPGIALIIFLWLDKKGNKNTDLIKKEVEDYLKKEEPKVH